MWSRRAALVLGLSASLPGCGGAGSVAGTALRPRRLAVKSGVVEFAFSQVPDTVETVYFDDYGEKQARYSTSDVHDERGVVQVTTVTLVAGDTVVEYDVDAKRGFERQAAESEGPVTTSLTEDQIAALSASEIAEVDLHVLDPVRIVGVVANGYAVRRKQVVVAQWGYRGVLLKSEVLVLNEGARDVESATHARAAQFDVRIDPAKLRVPDDVLISVE